MTSIRAVCSATAAPRSSSTSASARSIPAVTPADVTTSPSRTKIGSASTRTSGYRSASRSQLAQCVVARRPSSRPAWRKQERPGADARDPLRPAAPGSRPPRRARGRGAPRGRRRRARPASRSGPVLADRAVGPQAQPAAAADVAAVGRQQAQLRLRAGDQPGRVEDLPGTGDVEDLEALEADEDDGLGIGEAMAASSARSSLSVKSYIPRFPPSSPAAWQKATTIWTVPAAGSLVGTARQAPAVEEA